MQETQVWSLGWEDTLEKGMAIHSSILVWIIPWIEKPGGLQSKGSQRVGHDWTTNTSTFRVEQDGYIQYYKEKLLNLYITNYEF